MRRGVTVAGPADAIDRICHWLDTWRQQAPAGPWWPERISLPTKVRRDAMVRDTLAVLLRHSRRGTPADQELRGMAGRAGLRV